MKIGLGQINPTIADFESNIAKMIQFCDRAKKHACDLIIFPEMCITGYPPKDLLERPSFVDRSLNSLSKIVASIDGIGVICGFVDKNPSPTGKPLFNSAVLFEKKCILHKTHKRLLPAYDVFDENRYFEPGSVSEPVSYKGLRLGISICEDIWNDRDFSPKRIYPVDPIEELVKKGAELIINISASPYYSGKLEIREKILKNVACKYHVPVIYVNQIGGNDDLLFDGASLVINEKGEISAEGCDFDEDLIIYDAKSRHGEMHPVSKSDEESVIKALTVGLRDYVQKCRFSKVVLGLSGGIDSSLTAYIAVRALGKENVLGISMPSPFTSEESIEDAKKLADNLGIEFKIIPISNIFSGYLKEFSPVFSGLKEDITEQNIQARIRGNILMALSNKFGYLVLSTGNKSEIAVGYCTLYGDMSGGLAVISDVPKTLIYKIASYLNHDNEIIPRRVLEKPPTAELKFNQKDQDDLPPYPLLDAILHAFIEENKDADEIVSMGYSPDLVRDVISRVEKNEYKRYQAPPGLKVTTKAFGYGRRYPLARKL